MKSNLKLKKSDYLKAMENLDKNGIRYGDYGNANGPRCALGHLCEVKGAEAEAMAHLLAFKNGFTHYEITVFNDGGYDDNDNYQKTATKGDLLTFFAFGAAGAFKGLKVK